MMAAMPGDVVNDMGDIATSSDGVTVDGALYFGSVAVTRHQAALARPFGWRTVRQIDRDLVDVMTVWCLEMRSTQSWDDVRYRAYTTSVRRAEAFKAIPPIKFTDSGHKIIPVVTEHKAGTCRHSKIMVLRDHIEKAMRAT